MKGLLIWLAIAIPTLGGGLFYLGDGQELWNEMYGQQEVVEEEVVVEEVKPIELTTLQEIYVEVENCDTPEEIEALLNEYGIQFEYFPGSETYRNIKARYEVKDSDEELNIYESGDADYMYMDEKWGQRAITPDLYEGGKSRLDQMTELH